MNTQAELMIEASGLKKSQPYFSKVHDQEWFECDACGEMVDEGSINSDTICSDCEDNGVKKCKRCEDCVPFSGDVCTDCQSEIYQESMTEICDLIERVADGKVSMTTAKIEALDIVCKVRKI